MNVPMWLCKTTNQFLTELIDVISRAYIKVLYLIIWVIIFRSLKKRMKQKTKLSIMLFCLFLTTA